MAENEQPIGVLVRKLRRQQNQTQTQLGGEHYSKSYVSALERGKLTPSYRALQFFAVQLSLPEEYFTTLVEQTEQKQLTAPGAYAASVYGNESFASDEEWRLIDVLLEHSHLYDHQALPELPAFTLEHITMVPFSRQAGYAFLLGMSAQKKGEYETSLRALEYALAHASSHQRVAILDALGSTYSLQYAHAIALHYHLRAYHLLKSVDGSEGTVEQSQQSNGAGDKNGAFSPLQLDVILHCGDDYRALGAYQQASAMYEEARSHLNAEYNMQTAANLYLGLGYCLYGLVRHQMLSTPPQREHLSGEALEQLFQRSISLLLQGRSIFQVSGDSKGECNAQLMLMQVELDLSDELSRRLPQLARSTATLMEGRCSSLLDDVEEQCRQVLLRWQKDAADSADGDNRAHIVYIALASLVRVHIRRSLLARLNKQADTTLRERVLASMFCSEALEALRDGALPPEQLTRLFASKSGPLVSRDPTLPRVPTSRANPTKSVDIALGQVELYLAAGEVAEELGRAAVSKDYAHDCFDRADAFYLAAVELASSLVRQGAQDTGYLSRCYQRCIALLDERSVANPDSAEQTNRTLLELFRTELLRLPGLLVPVDLS